MPNVTVFLNRREFDALTEQCRRFKCSAYALAKKYIIKGMREGTDPESAGRKEAQPADSGKSRELDELDQ